jgi:Tfp pilus assembly protein PilO
MAWRGLQASYRYVFGIVAGVIVLTLCIVWFFKVRNIQRIKSEIVQLESKLSRGQELWKNYPPLTAEERKRLEKAQQRLFRTLPKEKEIPSLLEEISRLAREHTLVSVSFNTGPGAVSSGPSVGQAPQGSVPAAVVPQSSPAASPAAQEGSGPIESIPVKVTFAGDYREIAYFLEALRKIPRLVTIQTLKIQRGVPLLPTEVLLHAYYQKGELPAAR